MRIQQLKETHLVLAMAAARATPKDSLACQCKADLALDKLIIAMERQKLFSCTGASK